ncbi:c-type cytochrome [Devosia ginsengisoli]|nr:cytochrome c [Devosia ginsengisoli]
MSSRCAGRDEAAAGETEEAPAEDAAAAGDLPSFTEAQVASGKAAFDANCAVCHGDTLTNNTYGPPLAGEFFHENWEGAAAADLVAKVHTMPPSAPDSLSAEVYADMAAYILSVNGLPAGTEPLTAESGGTISFAQ